MHTNRPMVFALLTLGLAGPLAAQTQRTDAPPASATSATDRLQDQDRLQERDTLDRDQDQDRDRIQDRDTLDQDRDQDHDRVRDQDRDAIFGYDLMTDEERVAYARRMRELRTEQAREEFRRQHHERMVVRAKARGIVLPEAPVARRGRNRG